MALPLHRNQNSQTWGEPKEEPYWHFQAYGSRQSRHIGQEQSYGEASIYGSNPTSMLP